MSFSFSRWSPQMDRKYFFANGASWIAKTDSVESIADYETDSEYSFLIDKHPVVCADGLMMKCSFVDNTYVPQQMIGFDEFIDSVKRAIDVLQTPECSPKTNQKFEDHLLSRQRATSFGEWSSASQGSINSPPEIRRSNSCFRSRVSSLKSSRISPQSILLRNAKQKELNRSIESISSVTEEERFLKEKYAAQIKGFTETDYVCMESLRSIAEASAILEAIIENKIPTVIDLELNKDGSITLCYQAVNNFKQEFMMLRLKSDYCLFLAPF